MANEDKPEMSERGVEFSFVAFANAPFYQAINSNLVELSKLHPGQRVVDLACGTGGVTKIILEKLRGARESLVIGVDLSTSALKQAREDLQSAKDAMVEFVLGRAEQLSQLVREKVDAVVFCNAIHLVTDKARLSGEVFSTLRSGGVFAFNTSFFWVGDRFRRLSAMRSPIARFSASDRPVITLRGASGSIAYR